MRSVEKDWVGFEIGGREYSKSWRQRAGDFLRSIVRSWGSLDCGLKDLIRRAFSPEDFASFVTSDRLSEPLRFRFEDLLPVICNGNTVILSGDWSGIRNEENASSNRDRHDIVATYKKQRSSVEVDIMLRHFLEMIDFVTQLPL